MPRWPRPSSERFDIAMERPISELSKGNRQKVGLLLAFVHRPELLILDEPTTGLDPLVQSEFDHLVRETAADGLTVLLSSHSLAEVQRVADRVTIIREGRLVITDTVDHLRESAPRCREPALRPSRRPEPFRALESVQTRARPGRHARRCSSPVRWRRCSQEALRQGVVDLKARHADLDELFLSYYSGGERGLVIAQIADARPVVPPQEPHRLLGGDGRCTCSWSSRCTRPSRTRPTSTPSPRSSPGVGSAVRHRGLAHQRRSGGSAPTSTPTSSR